MKKEYKEPEDCWQFFKGFEKWYGNLKEESGFREMTLEDVKKKAREMGSNAIMIRHDLNKVYYKKFNDTLLPTDLFVAGDHCDMYIFDTALERVRLNQTFKECWRTIQGYDIKSRNVE